MVEVHNVHFQGQCAGIVGQPDLNAFVFAGGRDAKGGLAIYGSCPQVHDLVVVFNQVVYKSGVKKVSCRKVDVVFFVEGVHRIHNAAWRVYVAVVVFRVRVENELSAIVPVAAVAFVALGIDEHFVRALQVHLMLIEVFDQAEARHRRKERVVRNVVRRVQIKAACVQFADDGAHAVEQEDGRVVGLCVLC